MGTTVWRGSNPTADVGAGRGPGPTVWTGEALADVPIGVPGGVAGGVAAGGLPVEELRAEGDGPSVPREGAAASEVAALTPAARGPPRISPFWIASAAPATSTTTTASSASNWRC